MPLKRFLLPVLLTTAGFVTAAALGADPKPVNRVTPLTPWERAAQERAVRRLVRLGLPVYCAGGRKRQVALTFDDGPGVHTRHYVRYLARAGVPVTFFDVGSRAAARSAAVGLQMTVGEVGNHSWSHPMLTHLASAAVAGELRSTQRMLARSSGHPIQLMRPPYGAHDGRVDGLAREQGLLVVGWSVDSLDWATSSPSRVVANTVTDRLRPGAIVLLHESHLQGLRALPVIVAALRKRQLTPVTVSRLLADDPPRHGELVRDRRARGCVHLNRMPWPKPTPPKPPTAPPPTAPPTTPPATATTTAATTTSTTTAP